MPPFTNTRLKILGIVNGGFFMKATGIVRRIDDLGRIVIPKEIRRVLRIRESDPIEIFTDKEGQVILQKYSPLGDLMEVAENFADALASVCGHMVCISQQQEGREHILVSQSVKPQRRRFMQENLSSHRRASVTL